ncbi:MAG: hypothetical protein RJB66_140 [Pseudomonadota bacterium]|jgi:thiol-disulfide isomerase/thioredoxin
MSFNWKSKVDWILNIATVFLLFLMLWQRGPGIVEHFKVENQSAPSFRVPLLDGNFLVLNEKKQNVILVFWATWCGPCSLELSRIDEMIKNKEISADSIYAVSSNEEQSLLEKVVGERGYSFKVGVDGDGSVASLFGVKGTPTIVFINAEQKIDWITTGLSPFLGLRIKRFLVAKNKT